MFENCDTSLPSYDILYKLRTEIIKQEQTKLLHDYRVKLDCLKNTTLKTIKREGRIIAGLTIINKIGLWVTPSTLLNYLHTVTTGE